MANEEKGLATTRLTEIIGEASSQLGKVDPVLFHELELQPSVAMRHVLVHEYDQVDMLIVWETLKNDFPKVKKKIITIMQIKKKLKC